MGTYDFRQFDMEKFKSMSVEEKTYFVVKAYLEDKFITDKKEPQVDKFEYFLKILEYYIFIDKRVIQGNTYGHIINDFEYHTEFFNALLENSNTPSLVDKLFSHMGMILSKNDGTTISYVDVAESLGLLENEEEGYSKLNKNLGNIHRDSTTIKLEKVEREGQKLPDDFYIILNGTFLNTLFSLNLQEKDRHPLETVKRLVLLSKKWFEDSLLRSITYRQWMASEIVIIDEFLNQNLVFTMYRNLFERIEDGKVKSSELTKLEDITNEQAKKIDDLEAENALLKFKLSNKKLETVEEIEKLKARIAELETQIPNVENMTPSEKAKAGIISDTDYLFLWLYAHQMSLLGTASWFEVKKTVANYFYYPKINGINPNLKERPFENEKDTNVVAHLEFPVYTSFKNLQFEVEVLYLTMQNGYNLDTFKSAVSNKNKEHNDKLLDGLYEDYLKLIGMHSTKSDVRYFKSKNSFKKEFIKTLKRTTGRLDRLNNEGMEIDKDSLNQQSVIAFFKNKGGKSND